MVTIYGNLQRKFLGGVVSETGIKTLDGFKKKIT